MTLVPDRTWYDPMVGAFLHTGQDARDVGQEFLAGGPHQVLAADIETPGLSSYTINCITFAWRTMAGQVHSILLDPMHDPRDHALSKDMLATAGMILFHNSPFDVPILFHHKLLGEPEIRKVTDTIIHARMALPNNYTPKNLEALAIKYLGLDEFKGGMLTAFKAAGYKKKDDGYEGMSIESPIYRVGAMIDTIVTLKLEPLLRRAAFDWSLDHPFQVGACKTTADARELLETQHRVNRIMLRRSAVGLAVDPDYLVRYAESVDVEKQQAIAFLASHHDAKGPLVGGASKGLRIVEYIESQGQLPAGWPRSPKTRKLRATKDDLDTLDHPLARAQRTLAQIEKIEQYITKVQAQYEQTGRCHPHVNILGASQSGRMCIPTTHRILTTRGVLKYDEVRRGDWTIDMHGRATQITDVHVYSDQETLIREGRNGVRLEATEEHRWVSSAESGGGPSVGPLHPDHRRAIHLAPLVDGYDVKGRTIDAETDGERFAALIGMLVTDGRCVTTPGKGRGEMRAFVYQSSTKFLDEFLRVIPPEAVMYVRNTKATYHEIRIRTKWLRPRLEAAGIGVRPHLTDSPDLLMWVLGLSYRECAAFLRAAYLGDGRRSAVGPQTMVAQRAAARDAIRLAAYRLGVRTSVTSYPSTGWGSEDQVNVTFYGTNAVGTRDLRITEGRSDVWCVSTTTGTFTAWDDGPYLTGNSVNSPEYHQFSELARPIIADDGQGLTSIDWSQIEPVTMAMMAQDWEFLDPFIAGADLYEPIGRATGQPRKVNKVVLLAGIYGESVRALAPRIGHTVESAQQIRRQMYAAMPKCAKWMTKVTQVAETYQRGLTVGGRILAVTEEGSYKTVNHTCVTPDTPILTADLRHVPARSISVGDDLVGFDEYSLDPVGGRGKGKRRFRTAYVERVETIRKPGVMVSAGGRTTMCSTDHLWLARCPETQPRLRWVQADELQVGYHQLLSLGVWESDHSWEAGYLAGLYDGEGSMLCRTTGGSHTGLNFSQKPGQVMDAYCAAMDKLALPYAYSKRAPNSTSSTDNCRTHQLAKMMRVVGTIRPERFVARSREIFDGAELHTLRQMEAVPVVDDVIRIGEVEVMSIATTTRTFVANGFLSHNCQGSAYDIMAHSLIQMEEQGIADHVQLTMHDEIVVDTEVAEVAQKIMETPPPFLTERAGRYVTLRTDRNDMDHSWKKV